MNIDICRPITFHNQYIPLCESKDSKEWMYLAFGTVDGIDVGDDLFRADSQKNSYLETIWEDQKKFAQNIRTSSISHRIYAIYTGDKDWEKKFWRNELRYPYKFFCRLQCCGNKEQSISNKQKLQKLLNIPDELMSCVYLTYDNSDLMIVLKSAQYGIGAAVINKLHNGVNLSMGDNQDCYLKSSFTVCAISRKILEKESLIAEMRSENIPKVYLKFIEKVQGNPEIIKQELDKALSKTCGQVKITDTKPVLGADDQIIILENIDIKDLLRLYIPQTGILSRENPLLYNNVANITTVIMTDVEKQPGIEQIKFAPVRNWNDEEESHWKNVYKDIIEHIFKKLKSVDEECEYKELYTILNVLTKFTGELFNDYLLFPLLSPIDNLIDILVRNKKMCILMEEEEGTKRLGLNKEFFYDFVKSFSMYVQSTVITDRHATQMMDFNEKIYDIPVKVNAFYNAYLYKVKNILNVKGQYRYDLFVMPGMNSIVNVMELFPNHDLIDQQKSRLIKVEVPEQSAYDIQNIMVILAHETAHYVGGETLRNREKRYEVFCRSCAHIYTQYVRCVLMEKDLFIQDTELQEWEEIEDRVLDMISNGLERRENKRYWSKVLIPDADTKMVERRYEEYVKKKQYASVMTTALEQVLTEIGPDAINGIFFPILFKYDSERQDDIIEEIWQITERFTVSHFEGTTRTTMKTMVDAIMQIYEETFADIVSVLLLKLGLKTYVTEIIKNIREQGMTVEQLEQSDALIRICLIMVAVINSKDCFEEMSERWIYELRDAEKNDTEKNEEWYEVSRDALRLWSECNAEPEKMTANRQAEYEKNILYALRDKEILNAALSYLKQCVQDIKVVSEQQNVQEIQELYAAFSKESKMSAEEQILKMVTFINQYRKQLEFDWESYTGID